MLSLLFASLQAFNIFTRPSLRSPMVDTLHTTTHLFPSNGNNTTLFFGADYNPEQWPREIWNEDVKLMKEAGVNVVSIAIFSWASIQKSKDEWDFKWLDDAISLLHDNGISVDLGTSTASPPPWLTKLHPEILPVTDRGETVWPGARQHWRPTSSVFRHYSLGLVHKLAERYGNHPGVIAWHVNNELGCHNLFDYSDDAALGFQRWLKERYVTIDQLNFAWATAFWSQRYTEFDEILPPRLAATYPNPTQQLDFRRFSSDVLKDHLIAEREILHKYSPDRPVTTNFMITKGGRGMDYASWAEHVDFVSNDHYRGQTDPYDQDELSFSASLTSGVSKGKPWWLMEHSTSAVNWQSVNVAKKEGEMARDSLKHVAHGADAVCFFQWRQSKAGAEKFHSSMVPHAGPETRLFRDVVKLGQTIQNLAEIKGSSRLHAPVAILFDWEAWWASELDSHPSSLVSYYREALEYFITLLDLGIRVDILPIRNIDISSYQVVIAPVLYLVDDPLITNIGEFVKGGGHFITTYFSGIVDKNDHIRLGGYPGAWKTLLGINVEEFNPLLLGDKVKLDDGSQGDIWNEPIDIVGKNVTTIRHYAGNGKGAAVTRNKLGKGSASYISTSLGVEGLTKVLPDLLDPANVQSELPSSLRGAVEHVIRTDGKTEWTFLINRTDKELELDGVTGDLVVSTGVNESDGKLASRGVVVLRRPTRQD